MLNSVEGSSVILSVQLTPAKPSGHTQSKLPIVLLQMSEQPDTPATHSSMSEKREELKCEIRLLGGVEEG